MDPTGDILIFSKMNLTIVNPLKAGGEMRTHD